MHPNEELLRRQDELVSKGDIEGMFDTVTDDVVAHVSGQSQLAGDYIGKERNKEVFQRYLAALGDDAKLETHAILADDEHGVVLQTARVTKGDRSAEIMTVNIFHFRGGKVSELWTMDYDQHEADEFYRA